MAISFLKVFTSSRLGYQNKVTEPQTLAEDSDDEHSSKSKTSSPLPSTTTTTTTSSSSGNRGDNLISRRLSGLSFHSTRSSISLPKKSNSSHQLSSTNESGDKLSDLSDGENSLDSQFIVQSIDTVKEKTIDDNHDGPFSLVVQSMCPTEVIRHKTRLRTKRKQDITKKSDQIDTQEDEDRQEGDQIDSDDEQTHWLFQYDEYGFLISSITMVHSLQQSSTKPDDETQQKAMISFVEEPKVQSPIQDFLDFCEMTPKSSFSSNTFTFDDKRVKQQIDDSASVARQDNEDPFSPSMLNTTNVNDQQRTADENKLKDSTVIRLISSDKHGKKSSSNKCVTRWLTYLQLQYNHSCSSRLRWSQVELRLRRSAALDQLIEQTGVPSLLRSQLWMRSGEAAAFRSASRWSYARLCAASEHVNVFNDAKLGRVLPSNLCFQPPDGIGLNRLGRLLRVMRWLQREQPIVRWAESNEEKRSRLRQQNEKDGDGDKDEDDDEDDDDEDDDDAKADDDDDDDDEWKRMTITTTTTTITTTPIQSKKSNEIIRN